MGTGTVGYVRVSTSGQAEEGASLEAQTRKIRGYCELHDLDLIEIIEDAGLSGKSISGRPGIQRVLDLVKSRKVDNVVIYKIDRLVRNVKEAVEISELMQKRGCFLHSISEKLDTGSATGRLFYNIISAMAAWESEIIGERTSMAMERKAQAGEKISSQAPFGYKHINDKVVPNEEEQAIIKEIHTLTGKGYSIRGIVEHLDQHGYRNRKGKSFGRTEIWKVVKAAA
jgi:site-specific DNA recombinase